MPETNADMSGKICLVTGANSGIGKATALGLAQRGTTVVMVCRNSHKGEVARKELQERSGNSQVDLFIADLSSQQSIRQLVQDFQQRYTQLHVLVNNAGGVFPRGEVSPDGIEMTLAVNHLASFLLTNLLLDTIKASALARSVNVSSQAQASGFIDLDDLQGQLF
jgi:NAD(P)-dependent dehydrogenase (short-subunit alcohol dehydrogenase family)